MREFWIAKEYRRSGHGASLLALAEDYFRTHGLCASILTTRTAEAFYTRHGYRRAEGITAQNGQPILLKTLQP